MELSPPLFPLSLCLLYNKLTFPIAFGYDALVEGHIRDAGTVVAAGAAVQMIVVVVRGDNVILRLSGIWKHFRHLASTQQLLLPLLL